MARLKTIYRCQECAYNAPKPLGQCPGCEAWNSMVEEVVEVRSAALSGLARMKGDASSGSVALMDAIKAPACEKRAATGLAELDRLMGGGLVGGQVVLLAGPPGIGKSTLMLQAAARLASGGSKGLYVSGEESLKQVSSRALRLGVKTDSLFLLSETDLSKVLAALDQLKPDFFVLDSMQTIYHPELASAPGSVAQVRECAAELLRWSKNRDASAFLLGHVTKDGTLAGPKVLEHMVDTVLYFDTERHDLLRVLRAQKNRFGPTDEIGLFSMGEKGLQEVGDASSFFIADREDSRQPGRALSVALEGSRPMLIEVQALVVSTRYPLPRRMATGLDLNRVLVLLAAMEKHLRLRLEDRDVFASLAGGVRLKDPALDLACCLAVLSSAKDQALPADWVMIGEVGLLGQIGRVPHLETRLKEAAKAGFKKALVASRAAREMTRGIGLDLLGAADLQQAAERLFKDIG
ncbi:MAG: DNA repair protein RadA [Elusimicrobia bacterium]|nr:DNA repair protein RadA [Elusimicrobiota bacterium]